MGQDNAELIAEARSVLADMETRQEYDDCFARVVDALERVYGIRDDEWTAKNDLHRMNIGYPYPEENYLVRRHSATSWEPKPITRRPRILSRSDSATAPNQFGNH